jgi:glycosyltransferase involved in cell wall biosynthesis
MMNLVLYDYSMRCIAILPAYNAARSITSFVSRIPKNVFDEIIIIDDCSCDETYNIAKKIRGVTTFRNMRNLGYGGNVKMCLGVALLHKADVIVELHPDGEYDLDGIFPALIAVKKGSEMVLGNRFYRSLLASKTGMYWWKAIATRLLTGIDNVFLGSHIPDFHQGFRVYTKKLLESIPYKQTSNSYVFSFECIVLALQQKKQIAVVPVTTHYQGNKRGATAQSSWKYTLNTFITLLWCLPLLKNNKSTRSQKIPCCSTCNTNYLVRPIAIDACATYYCDYCQNAFTYPVPKDMGKYYPSSYFQTAGFLGAIKYFAFKVFQQRRIREIQSLISNGRILDVGSGSGDFSRSLQHSRYDVTNIDPYAHVNKTVDNIISGVLARNPSQQQPIYAKKQKYSAITFWESLEHTENPREQLHKAYSLLLPKGYLIVEYPRFSSVESKLFGRFWYHRDIPRHLVHFSDEGLKMLLESEHFTVIKQKSIGAWEYSVWGFFMSMVNIFYPLPTDRIKTGRGLTVVLFLSPLLLVSALVETVLWLMGDSPIGILIAQKKE